jgi:hypothetical protein
MAAGQSQHMKGTHLSLGLRAVSGLPGRCREESDAASPSSVSRSFAPSPRLNGVIMPCRPCRTAQVQRTGSEQVV